MLNVEDWAEIRRLRCAEDLPISQIARVMGVSRNTDPASRTSYVAGEIAHCDLWFPPIELPVRCGQVRTATQLPVLTMVTG